MSLIKSRLKVSSCVVPQLLHTLHANWRAQRATIMTLHILVTAGSIIIIFVAPNRPPSGNDLLYEKRKATTHPVRFLFN